MCARGKSRRITCRCGRSSRSRSASEESAEARRCRSRRSKSGSALEERVEHAPGQLVVHADADDVIVEVNALIARKRHAGRRIEIGFVLQSDIEIFDLGRPVRRELDLDATARGPTPV